MKTRTCIRMGAAMAALIVATTLTAMPSSASTPSSPAERAATAELNRNITLTNTAAQDEYRLRLAQYQAQLKQNEAQQQQYQAQLQSSQNNTGR
jgi:hypothetical protein